MRDFRRSTPNSRRTWNGRHRFEHWYRDSTIYFITARVTDRYPAFATEQAKAIFWDRFEKATADAGFTPWVTSLLDNHCHAIGYLRVGESLPVMMRHIQGGTAKLVNDILPSRIRPFWPHYFDGCLRSEEQGRLTYRHVLTQARRHGIVADWRDYPHTRVHVELEPAIKRALELNAFMVGVPYKRYQRHGD